MAILLCSGWYEHHSHSLSTAFMLHCLADDWSLFTGFCFSVGQLQWTKHIKKKKISGNVGMTDWWKKYGDRVGMEQVQEQPHVQLSTSHTHINITCGIGFQMQSDWLAYNEHTCLFTFLMCSFVYFYDGLWPLEMISLSPPVSTLILTSLQFCVFSIPLQAHSQKQRGKLESNSLKHFLSVWAWVTQVLDSCLLS